MTNANIDVQASCITTLLLFVINNFDLKMFNGTSFNDEYHLRKIHHHRERNIWGRHLFLLVCLDLRLCLFLLVRHLCQHLLVGLVVLWVLGFRCCRLGLVVRLGLVGLVVHCHRLVRLLLGQIFRLGLVGHCHLWVHLCHLVRLGLVGLVDLWDHLCLVDRSYHLGLLVLGFLERRDRLVGLGDLVGMVCMEVGLGWCRHPGVCLVCLGHLGFLGDLVYHFCLANLRHLVNLASSIRRSFGLDAFAMCGWQQSEQLRWLCFYRLHP